MFHVQIYPYSEFAASLEDLCWALYASIVDAGEEDGRGAVISVPAETTGGDLASLLGGYDLETDSYYGPLAVHGWYGYKA